MAAVVQLVVKLLSDEKTRGKIITVLAVFVCMIGFFFLLLFSFIVALLSSMEFYFPMPTHTSVSSHFEKGRTNPVTGKKENHNGTDFPAPIGTPIFAPASGEVVLVTQNSVEGNMVVLRHENGNVTRYKHCNAIFVKEGELVLPGEEIAECGETGQVTGAHLHFEMMVDGEFVDAFPLLQDWPEDLQPVVQKKDDKTKKNRVLSPK